MRLAIPTALLLCAVASAGAQTASDSAPRPHSLATGRVLGTIAADSIARAPVRRLSEMLTARIPGVQTFTRDGQVGAGSVAYVRGLSGSPVLSEPLLYIDGVRVEGRAAQHGPGVNVNLASGGQTGSARLDDIDPSEIAQVDVITGPAAALYGPGATNGVILVTTTRSNGGRPRVDLSAEGGVTTTPLRDGQSYLSWGNGTQCLTYQRAQGQCTVDSITQFNPLLSDRSKVTGTGNLQRYVASIGGGLAANALRYMVTGNYSDELGTLGLPGSETPFYQSQYGSVAPSDVRRPNAMDAAGVRGTMSGTFGSVADVTVSLGYLGNHQRSTDDGTLLQSAAFSPGYPPPAGMWSDVTPRPADLFADRTRDDVRRLTGSLSGDWHPVSAVRAFLTAGVDNVDEAATNRYSSPTDIVTDPYVFGANHRQQTARANANGGVAVTGTLAPGVVSRTTIGGEYLEDHYTRDDSSAVRFNDGAFFVSEEKAGVRAQTSSGYIEEALAVADRLFVSGGGRVDDMRTHRFVANTAVNGFVTAAFVPLPTAVPSLRLHGGYSTGSQLPTAEQIATNVPLVIQFPSGGFPIVETLRRPSPTREQDVDAGVSAGGWHGRLTADVTVYDRRTARAFLPVEFAGGQFAPVAFNAGVVQNRGIEGRVSATLIDRPAVGWDATLSAFGNQNRVAKDALPLVLENGLGVAAGRPLYGAWAAPYTYADANHDGAISPNEVTVGSTPAFVGSTVPTREASLASGVRLFHRRLRFAALLDYRGGYVLPDLAGEYRALAQGDQALNNVPASLNRQALAVVTSSTGLTNTTGWYQHVEAFRWRELSGTVTVQRFDITLAARNLALWTNYRGNDPDMDLTEGGGAYAATLRLPPPRTFLVRVATTL